VANTSRQFESFAQRHELPFLTIHCGPRNQTTTAGSVTRVALRRSAFTFPLDRSHEYDLALWQRYKEVARVVKDFGADMVQITGPGDLGMLGAYIAYKLRLPLVATWQTNVHQYARCRLARVVTFLPQRWREKFLNAVERWSFEAAMLFYRVPRFTFAPNVEMVERLKRATGKPSFLMSHSVDTAAFRPECRDRSPDRNDGPFTIGYVGRLTAEKNVRWLAALERSLLERGHRDFKLMVVGDGGDASWLQQNLQHAEFTGVLRGKSLSRAFANMDLFVFPSETDTFGLVVLEAMSSGVPAVVTASGGPKFTVRHGETGYVASNFEEFVSFTERLMTEPELLARMSLAAREYALSTSWERIFEGMYTTYERCLNVADRVPQQVLDVARV